MKDSVRILHLSDFHFRQSTDWDAEPVLRGLADAVRQFVNVGLAPDIVAITGDVAFSGKVEEYSLARAWLEQHLLAALPGFAPNNLLIVPGNHDVDRRLVSGSAQAVQRHLLEAGQDAIAEHFQSDDRTLLTRRASAFNEFAQRFGTPTTGEPWWATTRTIRGMTVGFAGLCSAWMCYREEEQGDLLLGRYQLNKVLGQLADVPVRVALLHHPYSYLREFDGEESAHRLQQECALVLRGHLHKEKSRIVLSPDKASLELAAGSAYAGSDYPNAFQLVELNLVSQDIRVHYRTWRDFQWIPDRNAYQNAPGGVSEFHLQRTSSAKTEGAPVTIEEGKLIAIGKDITARGEVVGTHGNQWRVKLQSPFVIGSVDELIRLSAEFDRLDRYDRFLLIAEFGEGYLLAAPPHWERVPGGVSVTLHVESRIPRSDVRMLPGDVKYYMKDSGKISFSWLGGDPEFVQGLERVPQLIMHLLSEVKDSRPIYADWGSRTRELFAKFGRIKLMESLILLELIRFAFIPRFSRIEKQEYTALSFIERVRSVTFSQVDQFDKWIGIDLLLELHGTQVLWKGSTHIYAPLLGQTQQR